MKANNLTICIDASCDKNCPYCISKMTFAPKPDFKLFSLNLDKARNMAKLASVSSVLITSKGEPLNNLDAIKICQNQFYDFPLEIQTNGEKLDDNMIRQLAFYRFNTIAISIDKYEDIFKFQEIYKTCHIFGITVRLTIVLTDLWTMEDGVRFLADCFDLGIKQVTFRHATIPEKRTETLMATEKMRWIKDHTGLVHAKFLSTFKRYQKPENLIRELPFGPSVYNAGGIAFTEIDYCVQESNNTEDIRSLIYHQDGHMYTSWDKQASILF